MPALNCVVKTGLCTDCCSKLLASYQSSLTTWYRYCECSAIYSCVAVHIGCYADSIAPPYLLTVQTDRT